MYLDKLFLFVLLFNFGISQEKQNYNVELMGQSILYGISYLGKQQENSSVCYQQLAHLFDEIEARHFWALKTLDVSGRPGAGFIYGNNHWLGSHAECIEISNRKKYEVNYNKVKHLNATPYDFPPFPLGFYVAHFEHNNTMQFHTQMSLEFLIQLGLCLPNSCSSEELEPLLNDYFQEKYLLSQQLFNIDLNLIRIRHLEDNGMFLLSSPKCIALILIMFTLIILAIVGTCYDVKKHNRAKNMITGHRGNLPGGKQSFGNVSQVDLVSNSSADGNQNESTNTIGEIVKCFSIYSNTKKLVDTNLPANSVKVVHGIKFFGMLWVILVHAVYFQNDYVENLPIAFRLSEDIFAQILSNSTYCVDTFLCMSGFLVGYLYLKSRKSENGNCLHKLIEFVMMFINRFLRLTPTYLFILLFTSVMYRYYRHTSALYSSENNDELCSKYWWRNLLYINNLYPRSEMCMSWSWYLSVDTQCFTAVTFLLILSTIKFKIAATLMILLMVGNVISTAYSSYVVGYIPTMDEQFRQLDTIYDFPWQRIGAYISGVITAYILVVKLEGKLLLKKRTKIILWTLFPLLNLWILFTIYTRNVSVEFSAIYMGISRTLWGVGMGWVLIACCTGNARALEKFLSFRGWIPFSRLTYSAYLLNPLMANMMYMGSEYPLNASIASFGLSTQGVAMTTYFLAYLLSILVESPSILLTKMLFDKIVKKKKTKESSGEV